jgi:uncharacterized protein YjbI with pentapeptide repeats
MLLKFLKIITIVALIVAIVWFVFEPGFEPAITAIVILAAILKLYWNEVKEEVSALSMARTSHVQKNDTAGQSFLHNNALANTGTEDTVSVYPGGSYIGSDFSGLDLKGMISKKADYRGACFAGANLQGAHFKGSNFENADLKGADLRQANLKEANLRGANLDDADLSGAFLVKADLSGASIKNTILAGANLKKTIMPGPARIEQSHIKSTVGNLQTQVPETRLSTDGKPQRKNVE